MPFLHYFVVRRGESWLFYTKKILCYISQTWIFHIYDVQLCFSRFPDGFLVLLFHGKDEEEKKATMKHDLY